MNRSACPTVRKNVNSDLSFKLAEELKEVTQRLKECVYPLTSCLMYIY